MVNFFNIFHQILSSLRFKHFRGAKEWFFRCLEALATQTNIEQTTNNVCDYVASAEMFRV